MMPTVRYAIGDKTVNACAGGGCGAGQARSTHDLARRLIGIKRPHRFVSKRLATKRDSLRHELMNVTSYAGLQRCLISTSRTSPVARIHFGRAPKPSS